MPMRYTPVRRRSERVYEDHDASDSPTMRSKSPILRGDRVLTSSLVGSSMLWRSGPYNLKFSSTQPDDEISTRN